MKIVNARRSAAVVSAAALAALSGTAAANAWDGNGTATTTAPSAGQTSQVQSTSPVALFGQADLIRQQVISITAGYLGISPDTLVSDLESGKTLAEIAPAGKTAGGLAEAIQQQSGLAAQLVSIVNVQGTLTSIVESLWTTPVVTVSDHPATGGTTADGDADDTAAAEDSSQARDGHDMTRAPEHAVSTVMSAATGTAQR